MVQRRRTVSVLPTRLEIARNLLAPQIRQCNTERVTDSQFNSTEQFDTARCSMLNWQADSLLTVVAPMLHAMQEAQSGTVESTRQLYEARQAFRDGVESLCRDLSADETEQLLMLTLVTLCERLTGLSSGNHV